MSIYDSQFYEIINDDVRGKSSEEPFVETVELNLVMGKKTNDSVVMISQMIHDEIMFRGYSFQFEKRDSCGIQFVVIEHNGFRFYEDDTKVMLKDYMLSRFPAASLKIKHYKFLNSVYKQFVFDGMLRQEENGKDSIDDPSLDF